MRNQLKKIILVAFFVLPTAAIAQKKTYIETLKEPNHWVDSVFKKLNKREKIAQMFFVRAHTNFSKAYQDSVGKVIKKERLGGVVFFQGGPGRQVALSNQYQSTAKVPLLVASDGEWGLGMRLDSAISYPYQMALGAVQDEKLLYEMGVEVAKDYKRIGMHINFAPVVDVNNNAKNPVINYRSFGENKYNVAKKAAQYMKGMQDGGLLVTLKHFPGHGDTDVDSHYDLPQLNFTAARLDSLEMYPFKQLISENASGVMIAHMNIPALDNSPNMPSTLSRPIVTDILKSQIGFKGLVVSDAMGMKGVVKYFKDGEADVMGILAGNDIIELSENSKRGIKLVRKAVRQGRISQDQIDESVRKILMAKYWAGLNRYAAKDENNVVEGVNRPESLHLIKKLADASMTLLKGKAYLKTLDANAKTVFLNIGTTENNVFQQELSKKYTNYTALKLDKNANANEVAQVLSKIGNNDQLIVGIYDTRIRPGNNLPLSADVLQFIKEMSAKNAVFALFANPYNLEKLKGIENSKALLIAYQKEEYMQQAAAEVLKNNTTPNGKLPVSVEPFFKYGEGQ